MKNSEAPWESFDAKTYEYHNYATLSAEDALILKLFWEHARAARTGDAVDVGTGANLIPILSLLAAGATHVDAWEFSHANVKWLTDIQAGPELPDNWLSVWKTLMPQGGSVMPAVRSRVTVQHGSIFDLPPQSWDYATMAFCAESITSDPDEFEYGVRKFVQCVRFGGQFSTAFMVDSEGYRVGAIEYPAVSVTETMVKQLFARLCHSFTTTPIPIVRPLRLGYSGMLVVQGIR